MIYPDRKRQRKASWPDLELALYKWQLRMTRKGAAITGLVLCEMANMIWERLPQYQDQEKPKFSEGWLAKFKSQYHIC